MQLSSLVEKEFRLIDRQKKALKRLGIKSINDLLFYLPARYEAFGERKNIIDLAEGDKTTVYGRVNEIKKKSSFKSHSSYASANIGDFTGTINAVWFRQPYVVNMLREGDKVALTGKITNSKNGLYIANPTFQKVNEYENLGEGSALLAVYPETSGMTSRWLRAAVKKALTSVENFPADSIPDEILEKYHLPSLKSSLIFMHTPQKLTDSEAARKRFSFEEIFFIQLARMKERSVLEQKHSFAISAPDDELEKFLKVFPFELTESQKKSIAHVAEDFKSGKPMSRLLEGDVGSGKTAVAVVAAWLAVQNGYQVAYMAPTEILTQQHFKSFINYFSQLRLTTKIGLLTSSVCKKYPSKVNAGEPTDISKAQLLKWIESGEIPILIGTHSLIQKSVKFKNLALVIIDEQHRFGTNQRAALASGKTGAVPHLLSMTATPIPRTLALTIYSDLDLSLLDQMPTGRQSVITEIIDACHRPDIYEKIRDKIKEGRQAYIICPKIDDEKTKTDNGQIKFPISNFQFPNNFQLPNFQTETDEEIKKEIKAVKSEAIRLQKIFPEFKIGILHGKMKPEEKDAALNEFRANKTQILCATSVVEVGIDIPNATIIIIEGAERFGLSQLHQLRGRVMRSSLQPYCYIFTESHAQTTRDRLKAFVAAKNGFELAEYDLQFRGPGELSGGKQWGVSDIGMDALKNIKMVEAAREEAQKIISTDPVLKNHPRILERLKTKDGKIHFE